ncbi:unknown [Firmicutes bacterium CAG:582]|nr:unknown [Firmicutes bacterium CAG:582]
MNDEYDELYNMLSSDREEINKIKDTFKEDITYYLSKIKNYQVNTIDITSEYDLENNYDQFKNNDIQIKYDLNKECIDYKIAMLLKYIDDLKIERRFLEFKRSKEDMLNKNEYQEYLRNDIFRNDLITKWYKEFETTE